MLMVAQLILLYAMPYRITDDKTGETNSGITIYGYDKTNFDPCQKIRGSFASKGRKPTKFNCSYDLLNKITYVPSLYEAEVEMESNRDMKGELRIVDLDFVGVLKTELVKPPVAVDADSNVKGK